MAIHYSNAPVDSFNSNNFHYDLVPMNGYNPPRYNVQIHILKMDGTWVETVCDAFHIYQDQRHDWKELAKEREKKMR